jgi:hypothetical protein
MRQRTEEGRKLVLFVVLLEGFPGWPFCALAAHEKIAAVCDVLLQVFTITFNDDIVPVSGPLIRLQDSCGAPVGSRSRSSHPDFESGLHGDTRGSFYQKQATALRV